MTPDNEISSRGEFRQYSDEWFTALYLEHGSINAVYAEHPRLPISFAAYHRLIARMGIVKGSGRNSMSLAQTLYVFGQKARNPDLTLAKVYHSVPLSMRKLKTFPTMASVWRIYRSIVTGNTTRLGVGVVVSTEWDPELVLTAKERYSVASSGKSSGDVTIPFGFTSKKLSFDKSVLRILQREYSTDLALEGKLALTSDGEFTSFARELIPEGITPFMELNILDVRVQIAHLVLPRQLCDLEDASSYAVEEHEFIRIPDSNESVLRPGMGEVFRSYRSYLNGGLVNLSPQLSTLNESLIKGN